MPDTAHDPASRFQTQFETLERQAHAAKLGMWVFLGSELLLFAGLFALFVTYRLQFPDGFREGVNDNTKVLGSVNTAVLLVSSTLVALGLHELRARRRGRAVTLVAATVVLGGVFLAIKVTEYASHFHRGIFPGGAGPFFAVHGQPGLAAFWTLYFVMTGLHAIHVVVGMALLATVALGMMTGKIALPSTHRLEIGAIYWHLVDMVWLFLWPLLYLA
jgi:cytochrome c oxidase subunit III